MKIVVLSQFHMFPGQPGTLRFAEFTRMWSEAGHEVTVIAGTVHYASGRAPEPYRRRWLTEEHEGRVRVLRCHVPDSYAAGYRGRMWAFFGFTLSAATAALRLRRADVVIATSPPLTVALPGWFAARWTRAKLVFEIRDLWPESAVTTGVLSPDGALTRALYALERWACRTADLVAVLTPAFAEDLVRRGLAGAERILLVPNGGDVDLFRPAPRDGPLRRELGWGDRFVVLYAGAHGRANAVDQLVHAAERLRDRPDILIATVGDGPERKRLEEAAKAAGLANIVFHGPVAKERMPEWVAACDLGAAVLQDNPTFRTVYPNKVFDYMCCERPTLLAIDGVARRLVCDEAQAGVFVKPEDPDAIAAAIRRLADDPDARAAMGRRGRAWVVANASRASIAARYLAALERLARDGRPRLSVAPPMAPRSPAPGWRTGPRASPR